MKNTESKENSYTYDREKWQEIIKLVGFNENSYDKIHEYIDNHVRYELQYSFLFNENLETSSLPLALNVLLKLEKEGLLNKIAFVNRTSGTEKINGKEYTFQIKAFAYNFGFPDDYELIPNLQDYNEHIYIDETINGLKNILKTCETLAIFILFARTMKDNRKITIFHRYCVL